MSDHKIEQLRLGEIFTYEINYLDEDTQKQESITRKAFFIQVENSFYLIWINDEDGKYEFMTEIANMQYNGEQRKGDNPFTLVEALRFIRSRRVTPTGKYVVENRIPKKQASKNLEVKVTSRPSGASAKTKLAARNNPFAQYVNVQYGNYEIKPGGYYSDND